MSSLKTLAFVGAVAMVAASAITTASAADLAPPPAPLMAPPPAPMLDSASGLYLRGDVGVGMMGESSVTSVITTPGYIVQNPRFDRKSFESNAFAGVGIGYQFNSFMRVDFTGELRTNTRYSATQSYDDIFGPQGCFNGRCDNAYSGSIRSSVFMANGYFDLGTWRGLTPFIGAGVGIANHKVSGLTDQAQAPTSGYGVAADKSKSALAWALMAGVGYEVTRNLKMEVGYRYLNMGNVSSGQIICHVAGACPNEVQKFKLDSHDVKIGFRYLLNDDAPAMSAPVMYAAPSPVIRKY